MVLNADIEAPAFKPLFISGTLEPLLNVSPVRFVKAAYERPARDAWGVTEPDLDGGGVELMARPLLDLHYPELSGFLQPFAGEFAAPRELLGSIPFATSHTTGMTIMIDLLDKVGLDAMVQVDLGVRRARGRFLGSPERESYAMPRAVDLRLRRSSSGDSHPPAEEYSWFPGMPPGVESYVRPVASPEGVRFQKQTVEPLERSLMARVLWGSGF